MEAELHDGTILEFPDGTDASVVQATVKKIVAQKRGIPTPGAQQQPAAPQEGLVSQFVRGVAELPRTVLEVPTALASGLVAPVIGSAYALGRQALEGKIGSPAGALEAANRAAETSNALTYEPRTAAGKTIVGGVNSALGAVAPAFPAIMGEMNAFASRPQIPAKPNVPSAEQQIAAGNDALRLQAIQTARDKGLKLNPATTSRTVANTVGESLVDPRRLNVGLYNENRPIVNSIARKEAGIPEGQALSKSAYDFAAKQAAQPYEELKAIPRFVTDEQYRANLNNRSFLNNLPEAEQLLLKNSDKVADLIERADLPEFTGAGAVEIMKQMRSEANAVLNNPAAKPKAIALANAQRNVAKQIEAMVDRNLERMDQADPSSGYGNLAKRFREGRTRIAKIKTLERVTDAAGDVDPTRLKSDKSHSSYTDGIKALNDIASIYPEAFAHPNSSNPGLSLTYGGRLNALKDIATSPIKSAMLSDWYQNRTANRAGPLRERLGYPFQSETPKIPLEISDQAWRSESPFQTPAPQDRGLLSLGGTPEQPTGSNLSMGVIDWPKSEPQVGTTKAQDYQAAMRRDAIAETRQRLAEEASRQPTGRGIALEMAPNGRLRPADQGMKGATPDVISSTGHELNSAVGKISQGFNAGLTATERIAWNKTKVDIVTVDSSMRGLTDSQIAGKMMDRQWVADAIQKAQEKARGFDEISKRAKDAETIRKAAAERERMLDFAESLDESLRGDRPIISGSQGPKTRRAILERNQGIQP